MNFIFFMLILITANNFLQMFVGWEGVGLSSYLLINFWFTRIQANKAAIKALPATPKGGKPIYPTLDDTITAKSLVASLWGTL